MSNLIKILSSIEVCLKLWDKLNFFQKDEEKSAFSHTKIIIFALLTIALNKFPIIIINLIFDLGKALMD